MFKTFIVPEVMHIVLCNYVATALCTYKRVLNTSCFDILLLNMRWICVVLLLNIIIDFKCLYEWQNNNLHTGGELDIYEYCVLNMCVCVLF